MAWRSAVNGVIKQLTGYQLTRVPVPAPRQAAHASESVPPAQAPKPKPTPKPKGLVLPEDYDDEAKDIIRAVKPYTMTSPERLNAFILATRHIVKHDIPGDIVECGVWRGGSMQACAKALLAQGDTERDLYLFDTYEGMTPPTEQDLRRDGKSAEELLAAQGKDRPIWAVATLDDVKSGFRSVPYPEDRLHFVRGKVEDTVPRQAPEQISILRLDTDWYASTKHELDHLYDRLVPGGVLLIDDYGYWQGSRQAVDEFLEKTGERLLLLRMDEGRIAVKP
ncbi:TylF/MycF/NovP-related O-methyltransferase [Streptomyces sp. NBC_00401]|uniref:TylF/MycF/NovP-related O-methyltransferase n=1 Tax=unclassified Streptomyces TaxID=2593676 RepID=UPI0022575A69|nr:TylF/MycF/NovP-related O-methyltransferase [Streptomyces sp. NBC_00401]MCX5082084.1 TylF/MycF family methyltransferase [Streptomyces sp. NBC_00401]